MNKLKIQYTYAKNTLVGNVYIMGSLRAAAEKKVQRRLGWFGLHVDVYVIASLLLLCVFLL